MSDPLRLVIGYDATEKAGVYTFIESVLKHASRPVMFTLLAKDTLRKDNLYWRERGEDEATEFSRTRFLAPYLAGYKGQVAFLDGADMICQGDIAELFEYCHPGQDLAVVKLDYKPSATTKFGNTGTQQRPYKYKLWSSVCVFNAYTPACQRLTPKYINEATGAELHQFDWVVTRHAATATPKDFDKDAIIARRVGEIPEEWNYIPGHSGFPIEEAKLVHLTMGGPWHPGHGVHDEADKLWVDACREIQS